MGSGVSSAGAVECDKECVGPHSRLVFSPFPVFPTGHESSVGELRERMTDRAVADIEKRREFADTEFFTRDV